MTVTVQALQKSWEGMPEEESDLRKQT